MRRLTRLLTSIEHMKMAALMHRQSQRATKPENRIKLAELASAHRTIARIRIEKTINAAEAANEGIPMSVHELMTLAREHWKEFLPEKVKRLRADRMLEAETNAAANMAQDEIERLMKMGYQEHEAREVALPTFILLPPEDDGLDDDQREELAEKERWYQNWMADPPGTDQE